MASSIRLAAVADLERLLERRNNEPGNRDRIDREIRRRFERKRATFVLDMAGFSISVQRHGIIHHLAKIHRMRVAVEEVTRSCRGRVVKFEADNAFVTFATVNAAVDAAVRVNALVKERNQEAAK